MAKGKRGKKSRSGGRKAKGRGAPYERLVDDGFSYGQRNYHDQVRNQAETLEVVHFHPNNNTDLTGKVEANAYFEFKTNRNQFLRFAEHPIVLEYTVEMPNTVDNNGDAKAKSPYWFANATDNHTCHLLPQAGGARAFVHSVEVSLNGRSLTDRLQFQGLASVYTSMNNIVATEQDRALAGCHPIMTNEHDLNPPKKGAGDDMDFFGNPAYHASQLDLLHTSWSDSTPIVRQVCFPGVPFMSSPQCHALRACDKKRTVNEQSFLPPNTNVSITVRLQADLAKYIVFDQESDMHYFKNATPDDTYTPKKPRVTMKRIYLAAESFVPTSHRLRDEFMHSTVRYAMDTPYMFSTLLRSACLRDTVKIKLPARTAMLYATVAFSHSLWYNSASKRSLRPTFAFPKEMSDMSIKLVPNQSIIAPNMGDLHGPGARRNPILRAYHANMVRQGMINDSFDLIWPWKPARSWIQLLAMNTKPYKIDGETDCDVTVEFQDGSVCPENLFLVVCAVVENAVVKRGDVWTLERLTHN